MPLVHGQELGSGALLFKVTERVMIGKISERGEFYEVEIAPNSRVSVPKQNVSQVAGSLEELYQAKRSAISQWSAGDHYQMTRWCILNNLLAHAAEHYAETARRSPDHPRVRQLGVELQERMLQDENFRQYIGLAPRQSQPASSETTTAERSTVQSDAAKRPTVVAASSLGSLRAGHSSQGSPEITRHFTERVQPILLNRCGQAACHGAQSNNALRLGPPYASGAARTTSENLASVLQLVSADPTQTSPLMHYATHAHGIQPAPAIADTEAKLIQELDSWIAFVRNPVVSAVVTSVTPLGTQVRTAEQFRLEPYATAVTLIPVNPGAPQLRSVPQESLVPAPTGTAPSTSNGTLPGTLAAFPSSAFPVGTQPPTPAELDALDAQLKAALGELPEATKAASGDPFDPAEFNRRLK